MDRWRELISQVTSEHGDEKFFRGFDASIEHIPAKRKVYLLYERAFEYLDDVSWKRLIAKATTNERKMLQEVGLIIASWPTAPSLDALSRVPVRIQEDDPRLPPRSHPRESSAV